MTENKVVAFYALDTWLQGSRLLGSGLSPDMAGDNSGHKLRVISAGQLGPTAGLIATNSFPALYYQC